MGIPFLITGLPRTRTAWMAIVASMGPASICFHEPIMALGSWAEAKKLWQDCAYKYTGLADSAAGFHLAEILATVRPRTLIIERDRAAVNWSLQKLNGVQTNYCDLLAAHLATASDNPLVMTVPFEELRDPDCILECLLWLMPSLVFDRRKIEQLQTMNITVDMDRVWGLAEERKSNLAEIIGPDAENLRAVAGVS